MLGKSNLNPNKWFAVIYNWGISGYSVAVHHCIQSDDIRQCILLSFKWDLAEHVSVWPLRAANEVNTPC